LSSGWPLILSLPRPPIGRADGDREILRVRLTECVCGRHSEIRVSAAAGVPEMVPAELSVRPAGRDPPVTLHVRAPRPPVARNVWL
jgi:hypothetical protein